MTTLDTLKEEIATELQAVKSAVSTALQHAAKVGKLLQDVKAQKKRTWTKWVEENFGLCYKTCTNYIRIADNWPLLEGIDGLTMSDALSMLSGPSKKKDKPASKAGSNKPAVGTLLRIVLKPGTDLNTVKAMLSTVATVEEVRLTRRDKVEVVPCIAAAA